MSEPAITLFTYFTGRGKLKNVRRSLVFWARDMDEMEVLKAEIKEKAKRLTRHELERKIIELYSFGYVLDIGCGKHKMGDIGIDVEKSEEVDILADAQHLPFRPRTFDCVIAHHVIEHVPDAARAVFEMKKAAKSSVIIVIPQFESSFVCPHHVHHFQEEPFKKALEKVFHLEKVYSICNSVVFICQNWVSESEGFASYVG